MGLGAGDRLAGRFELIEQLGEGGFGTVFRAFDLIEEHEVAVKVITARDDIVMVRREFRPLRRLSHPNIVKVFEPAFAGDGQWVIPFELVDGPNLREVLNRNGTLTLASLRDLGTQLLSALCAIHPDEARIEQLERRGSDGDLDQEMFDRLQELKASGLVHRDVKPENLICRSDGEFVLVDFGISSRAGTQMRTQRGTPAYWPPDLTLGALDRWDPDVDRYAVGATLFETACGRLPYEGLDRECHLLEPSALRDDLPGDVRDFLVRACQPARDRRFSTTLEMTEAWRDAWAGVDLNAQAVAHFRPWPIDYGLRDAQLDAEALHELVVEIVGAEGPIICRRLYDLIEEATGTRPTSLLNRIVYRMVGQWDGPLEQVEPLGNGQQDKTVYMAGTSPRVFRTLGDRSLWELPRIELAIHLVLARRVLGLAEETDADTDEVAAIAASTLGPDLAPHEQRGLAADVRARITGSPRVLTDDEVRALLERVGGSS